MGDMPLDQSKIIFRNGSSNRLPRALDPGELAVTIDSQQVFVGPDLRYGYRLSDRNEFPYQNIEFLTEQSDAPFSKLHSERMREGIHHDYYEARLDPDTVKWTTVRVVIDSELIDYKIPLRENISAFIDYTVVSDDSGEPLRSGQIILWYYDNDTSFTDHASHSRDSTQIGKSSYDPRDVFGRIKFRFLQESGFLVFQYRNWSFDAHTINFKVSRPYLEATEEEQVEE